MKRFFRSLLIGAIVFAVGGPAPSQDLSRETNNLHPGIIGEDARVQLEERGAPWDAIGQVNVDVIEGVVYARERWSRRRLS